MTLLETYQEQRKVLDTKLARVKELAVSINLRGGQTLTREQQMEDENLKGKLEFRLTDLATRYKIEEADIRIAIFEEMIKTLNKKA